MSRLLERMATTPPPCKQASAKLRGPVSAFFKKIAESHPTGCSLRAAAQKNCETLLRSPSYRSQAEALAARKDAGAVKLLGQLK